MSLTGYSYPWDYVGDDDAADRAASLGLDSVALASVYHATRTATPLHPSRKITTVSRSAMYAPVRDNAWKGRRLRPGVPDEWVGEGSFERATAQLGERGLNVLGWVVLTHHDELGVIAPDLAVRNAFGDHYSYALCPSHEEVRDYCRTLCLETLRAAPLRGLVLEACGQMGVEHASTHDKTDMARWSDVERGLLSICFCTACEKEFENSGVHVGELSHMIRAALAKDATSLEDALAHYVEAVGAVQMLRSTRLQREISIALREVRPDLEIVLHASAHPCSSGSFAASDAETLAGVDVAVARCWGDIDESERELASLATLSRRLGAYLRLDHEWERLHHMLDRAAALGVSELHLYHVGLLTRASSHTARRLADYWRTVTKSGGL